jgi:hypothetical protein
MRKLIAAGMTLIRDALMLTLLMSMIGFASYFAIADSAYADVSSPKQAITEIEKDLSTENRGELYEEEVKVIENPKVEIEKQYEENVKEYFEENPDQGNVLEKVKDLVTPDTK